MRNPLTIFTGTPGLNNRVDPVRLKLDRETGIADLAEATDVTIDDTGRPSRRLGSGLITAGVFHSGFCDGGDCFVVQDHEAESAIYKLSTLHALTGVRSALTKGLRFGWCQVGPDTYYSNTLQNGIITAGVSRAWALQSHVGAVTTRQFSAAPLGSHLAHFAGRMWIATGNVLYYSEPFAYGKFDLANCFIWFGSNITMVKPVKDGLFVSDSDRTYFLAGTNPKEFDQKTDVEAPAHEYSEAIGYIDGDKVGRPGAGPCAVWSCDEGLCVSTQTGDLQIVTANRLIYPTGSSGATVISDQTAINAVGTQCVAVNLKTGAPSTFTNYGYGSMVNFNGEMFGTKATGLYEIGTSQLDGSTAIDGALTLPTVDIGEMYKRIRYVYFGLQGTGNLRLTVTTDLTTVREYTIPLDGTGQQRVRVKLDRNVKGRYWAFRIVNLQGCGFSLDEVQLHHF